MRAIGGKAYANIPVQSIDRLSTARADWSGIGETYTGTGCSDMWQTGRYVECPKGDTGLETLPFVVAIR